MHPFGEISAGGKINLYLKVTGKRADGYHELETLFVPVKFPADRISVSESASGITLECPAFPDCPPEKNLAYRAAELYRRLSGVKEGWRIILDKKIPAAAGLGGGSVDAAAVLKLLNDRYQALTDAELAAGALTLGADVPFFLAGQPMRATGVGEKLEAFELPENMPELLLLFPGFPVSARWAYTALNPGLIGPGTVPSTAEYRQAFADPARADWTQLVRNDLAFALFEKFPLCTLLKEFLLEQGAYCVQISGSGSSLFALFASRKAAVEAACRMRSDELCNPYFRIFAGGEEL